MKMIKWVCAGIMGLATVGAVAFASCGKSAKTYTTLRPRVAS